MRTHGTFSNLLHLSKIKNFMSFQARRGRRTSTELSIATTSASSWRKSSTTVATSRSAAKPSSPSRSLSPNARWKFGSRIVAQRNGSRTRNATKLSSVLGSPEVLTSKSTTRPEVTYKDYRCLYIRIQCNQQLSKILTTFAISLQRIAHRNYQKRQFSLVFLRICP